MFGFGKVRKKEEKKVKENGFIIKNTKKKIKYK